MSPELFWLTLTVLTTAFMWPVYVVDRFRVRGLVATLGNPVPYEAAAWAERARHAHANAVENLVLFAPLAVSVHVVEAGNATTALAAAAYFWARLAHFVVYTAGIAVVRTLLFAVGAAAQIVLAVSLLAL